MKIIGLIFFILILPVLLLSLGNTCLEFTRSDADYVIVGTQQTFNFIGDADFTVEAWVYPYTETDDMQIISKGNDGTYTQWELKTTDIEPNGDGLRISFRSWSDLGVESISYIPLNTWTHLAGVFYANPDPQIYGGDNWYIYIDGVLDNTDLHSGPLTSEEQTWIGGVSRPSGANDGQYYQCWNGKIDDVRIWNVARTQPEIEQNMYTVFTPSIPNDRAIPTNLIGYWTFEAGSPFDIVYDISGHNVTGQLGSAPDDYVVSGNNGPNNPRWDGDPP